LLQKLFSSLHIKMFLQPSWLSCTDCSSLILRRPICRAVSSSSTTAAGSNTRLLGRNSWRASGLSDHYDIVATSSCVYSNRGRFCGDGCSSLASAPSSSLVDSVVVLRTTSWVARVPGLALVDGMTRAFDATSSTLFFHALFRGKG
jgi:hypothetical protein